MTASLAASAHLVDGADLAATGVTLTHDGAGLWSGLAETVVASAFPGIDGGDITGGVFPSYTYSTMYAVHGNDFDDVWSKIRALRRRCKPGRSVTLTREMPDPEGGSSNTDETTTARRQSDRIEWTGIADATIDIDWLVTGGPWHGPSVAISSGAGTQTIIGDVRTRRITLTLASGTAPTVMNTTNGYWVQFDTTVPTGGVLIDVEARTAAAVTGGADLSQYLQWGKGFPMQFEPGSNVLTVDHGTFSIDYCPAYL